jgi:hypothetical protein
LQLTVPTFITTTQSAVPNVHHPKLNHHNTIAIGISQRSSPQHNQQFPMFITQNSPVADSSPYAEGQSAPCFETNKDHPAVTTATPLCILL